MSLLFKAGVNFSHLGRIKRLLFSYRIDHGEQEVAKNFECQELTLCDMIRVFKMQRAVGQISVTSMKKNCNKPPQCRLFQVPPSTRNSYWWVLSLRLLENDEATSDPKVLKHSKSFFQIREKGNHFRIIWTLNPFHNNVNALKIKDLKV